MVLNICLPDGYGLRKGIEPPTKKTFFDLNFFYFRRSGQKGKDSHLHESSGEDEGK